MNRKNGKQSMMGVLLLAVFINCTWIQYGVAGISLTAGDVTTWCKTWGDTDGNERGSAVWQDMSGDIYTVARSGGISYYDDSLMKWDEAGNLLWTKALPKVTDW